VRPALRALAAALAAALVPAQAGAQERQRGTCEVTIGRGATQSGGANGSMQVESGRSCGTTVMRRPERNEPTASLTLASPPAHGQVTITQPNRFDYTPAPGFVGEDRFVITGERSPFRVAMTVTVLRTGQARR
jgi:hypothetical protein